MVAGRPFQYKTLMIPAIFLVNGMISSSVLFTNTYDLKMGSAEVMLRKNCLDLLWFRGQKFSMCFLESEREIFLSQCGFVYTAYQFFCIFNNLKFAVIQRIDMATLRRSCNKDNLFNIGNEFFKINFSYFEYCANSLKMMDLQLFRVLWN